MTFLRTSISALAFACLALGPTIVAAQSLDDPSRLVGLGEVAVRVEAVWDDAITVEAGGATADQFLEALRQTFREAIATVDAAPSVRDEAEVTVNCHVDTFYETGQILYSLRVQTERADPGGTVVTWIESWVGNYTVQQLHLMFRLGEQCAEGFLQAWRAANEAPAVRFEPHRHGVDR